MAQQSISVVLLSFAIILTTVIAAPQKLRLQPELDVIDIEVYLKNPRLFDIQVKCVAFDGPCDAVGRFLKPRVASALVGQCEFCTPKQTKDINRIISFVQEEKPELYRALIEKYIAAAGIAIPSEKPNESAKVQSVVAPGNPSGKSEAATATGNDLVAKASENSGAAAVAPLPSTN